MRAHTTRPRISLQTAAGSIPSTFSKLASTLNRLDIANNELSGDLSPLAPTRLMHVTVHNNPKARARLLWTPTFIITLLC